MLASSRSCIAILATWTVSLAAPLAAVQPSQESSVTIAVVDAITLEPIEGALVEATYLGGFFSSFTDALGVASFPTIEPVPAPLTPGTWVDPTLVSICASSQDHLPIVKDLALNTAVHRLELRLVPRNGGTLTPMIDATTGGRFQLPGIGSLIVKPNALGQDAHLRLIRIPDASTSPSQLTSILVAQYWLSAIDDAGNDIDVLSSSLGEVLLTTELRNVPDPATGTTRKLTAHRFDEDWVETGSAPLSAPSGSGSMTVAMASGFTAVGCEDSCAPPTSCLHEDWVLEVVVTEQTVLAAGGVPVSVNCGIYANKVCYEVQAGETKTTGWTWGGSMFGEAGWQAGAFFAKASAKLGLTVSGDYSTQTATFVMAKGSKCTPKSGTISGIKQGSQGQPWSCVTGSAKYGTRLTTYDFWAVQYCTPIGSGTPDVVKRYLVMSLPVPSIGIEWDVAMDAACGAGCDSASMPDLPK